MSSENFIEIWVEDEDSLTTYSATRSQTKWKKGGLSTLSSWQVDGTNLHVYDKDDIAALRKLLDAIEERLEDNN